VVRREIATVGALLACALWLLGGTAWASEFDHAMQPVLDSYLEIQRALAGDSTEGVHESVSAIQEAARQLDPAKLGGEHAGHFGNIPADLAAACQKMHASHEIGAMREAFKELSQPLTMWVGMAEPADTSVMYCPMAKARWVQRGSSVANPYFGAKMLTCGEKVGGAD
jgi:Cu(I)/Ag(I) efflux system membrane fusion protein